MASMSWKGLNEVIMQSQFQPILSLKDNDEVWRYNIIQHTRVIRKILKYYAVCIHLMHPNNQ